MDLTDEVRRYWDERSASFDRGAADAARWHTVYTDALATMLPGHDRALDILDVGVGTGFAAIPLAAAGHRVTGVDISPGMLARTGRKAAEAGVQVRLIACSAQSLPDLGAVDVVMCRNLLWTLPDPRAALTCWRSTLRPGGVLLVSDALWNTHLDDDRPAQAPPSAPNHSAEVQRRFAASYLPLRDRLPYFRGLGPDDALALLAEAGYRDQRHFDTLFADPVPRDPALDNHTAPPGFFVLGARSPA